jgi:hypothetical protein
MKMNVYVKEFEKEMADLTQLKKSVMKSAYNHFVSITPKDKGNARGNTNLIRDVIEADYPYAERLDNGWSKQYGGKGMTKPTEEFIEKEINKILKGK